VTLATVLAAAGLTPKAREIVVEGADRGYVAKAGDTIAFARSLGLETALHPDTLLAYAMNGEPLSAAHGFPVRLIVPGWYGMASVKWVRRIEAIGGTFDGFYQTRQYVMDKPDSGESAGTPLTTMRTRSLITAPTVGARLRRGRYCVRGLAWSGSAPVTCVEVSVDGGTSWEPAEFASGPERYAWRRWEFLWEATDAGPATLRSRAFDTASNTQPDEPEWNQLGYANNAIQVVEVMVE
jgi:DMSO/TMAO reductase YedYZ molybdopterin-dependent catalytic subunit